MAVYTGLDLPIYGPEVTVLSTKAHLSTVTGAPDSTFVRRVRIEALGYASLLEALQTADQAFEWVCEMAEAEVVGHRWGLRRFNPQDERYSNVYRHSPLLPAHYMLVAEVDAIRDLGALTEDQYEHVESARKTYMHHTDGDGPRWEENRAFQFRNGRCDFGPLSKLWLLDIEPVLV